MAKRKTIKHNPLDNLSNETTQEVPAGFEHLLGETDKSSKRGQSKPARKGNSVGLKGSKRQNPSPSSQSLVTEMLMSEEEIEKETTKGTLVKSSQPPKSSKPSVPPNNLAQRVTQLEEDNRLQNIMIGIVMIPLALLALLGAAWL